MKNIHHLVCFALALAALAPTTSAFAGEIPCVDHGVPCLPTCTPGTGTLPTFDPCMSPSPVASPQDCCPLDAVYDNS